MSNNSPRKLTIEYLRGSVQPFTLTFEKGKKLTIIYGENGTGKSTICDAFEFIGKGNIGSLDNRGLGKTNRYWHSVGKKPGEMAVTLETASTVCRATLGKTEVICSPPEHRPRVEVLRRAQILSLVEAKPAERYAAISRFIDVSGIEASEAALGDAIRNIEKSLEIAEARLQENRDTLQQFWEEAGRPGTNPLQWAEVETQQEAKPHADEIKALAVLQSAYARLTDYPAQLNAAEQSQQQAAVAVEAAQQQLEAALATAAKDAAQMVRLLEAAKSYFAQQAEAPTCPLCGSAERASGLAQRIDERIGSFTTLQHSQTAQQSKEAELQRGNQRLAELRQSAAQRVQEFAAACQTAALPAETVLPSASLPDEIADWPGWFNETANLPAGWKKQEAARQDKQQFLGTLKRAVQTCQENTATQQDLEKLLPRLKRALEIVKAERHQFTDATLSAIAAEVGRLYEAVHPGEGLNKISLELDPKRRASLEIGADFCGQQKTPPQAYFSDSHLDTLGLCVFLALTALDDPAETILVLDDVLASVDEPHVERLIEMLYAETLKFQHCIFTTHYRPWKQKLRWGWLQHGQCHFVELTKWTTSTGLTLIRSVPEVERLQQLLAETPPDPQLVCAKAGVILEAALDFLTLHYECAAPRRLSGLYTLGELLPAVDSKLRKSLKVEVFKERDASGQAVYEAILLAECLNELTRIAQARNVFGCHFNQLSFDLLEDDALGFGQQVLALVGALADEEAGWPRNGKSGSYWATTGETRRLHPYKKPS